MEKYTIKTIAELAGVSKGTVDRVIHKRGKVSAKAFEKVNAVLDQIDYKPNLLARSLKKGKNYHICVILPDYKIDPYWIPCNDGINDAIKEFNSFGVFIQPFYFDPSDVTTFIEANHKVLELAPNAALIAPLFHKETVEILTNYLEKNIIVSKFNNQIETDKTKNFVGQDLFKSGRIAANLLKMVLPKKASIAIIHINEDYNNAIYVQEKEKGFRNYFEELNNSNYKVTTHSFKENELFKKLKSNISKDVQAIFVTTSKTYKIAEALQKNTIDHIKLIGYDLLDENIEYLNNNTIDFLIHQNPKQQVYLGLSFLVEHFLFDKEIPTKSLLPIDIITSENLETYIEN